MRGVGFMDIKKLLNYLFYPHIILLILLTPITVLLLIRALNSGEPSSAFSIVSYTLSAYTLTLLCLRIPRMIGFFKSFKNTNTLIKRWFEDLHFKAKASLCASFLWNAAYAILQAALAITHKSFWFASLSLYYWLLSVMRIFLLYHLTKYKPGEKTILELKKFKICGIVILLMNIVFSLMIFFIVYWNRSFNHNQITAIAVAAYTFTSMIMAILGVIKYRSINIPVYSAAKSISFIAACVSMMTLEATMLNTFNDGTMSPAIKQTLLIISGAVISVIIISVAIRMIIYSNRELKKIYNNLHKV